VLEQLGGDDDVERRIVERKRLIHVGPHRLDPERGSRVERIPVHVDPDDLVARCVRARQGAGAAAEVEDQLAGATDDST
jgi:hypothetical protein